MASIGIDDLRTRTSEVLRRVREHGETLDVTEGGQVVAHVIPVEQSSNTEPGQSDGPEARREAMRAWMRDMEPLIADLATTWPKGVSAQDVIDDVRRDL